MTASKGKLYLKDSPESPTWITASKTFSVNVDETPLFLVNVSEASDDGTVKLIRLKPRDKRVALLISAPGLYAIDMKKTFGWKGNIDIEACLYSIGDESEITYSFVKFASALTPEEEELIRKREASGNTKLEVVSFEVVPLFNACSYYFKSAFREKLAVFYRQQDGEWRQAFEPVYVESDGMYRGSIVDLHEDTAYDLKIVGADDEILAQGPFRTWRSDVPVAKTIVLDETSFSGHLKVKESGSPDGWIKITAADGFVLRNDRKGPLIELSRTKYILLEGLTLRGGLREAITIRKCEYVRVVNCDISGWGREGIQRLDLDGKYYVPEGGAINWDTAILISRSLGTVVERCYIHDPINRANSWYYSHPSGPQAVGIDKPSSTVLRYNDFIGSDAHRWNDAVEGSGNFSIDGGFNRDADIYGNMMCFANDDAIEIDGGQINVRVFDNKFEGCLCGVSIQGCMSGPSYLFRNLMVNMGDDRGLAGQTIKTSSYANGPDAVSFIFNNTCFGKSSDLNLLRNLRIVAKNNIFAGRNAIRGRDRSPQSDCDYNLLVNGKEDEEEHGIVADPAFADSASGRFDLAAASPAIGRGTTIRNFEETPGREVDMGAIPHSSGKILPERPIPVSLDRYQLVFPAGKESGQDTKALLSPDIGSSPGSGADRPEPQSPSVSAIPSHSPKESGQDTMQVTATVTGGGFSSSYRIAQNEAFDWFTVTPSEGVLSAGAPTTITVRLMREKMTDRALYKGVFLVRLANGYSRPVMVYAYANFVAPVKPEAGTNWVQYLEAENPSGGILYDVSDDAKASGGKFVHVSGDKGKQPVEYNFTVPKAGKYHILMRVRSEYPPGMHDSILFSVDGGKLERSQLRTSTEWSWAMAAQNRKMSLICLQPRELAPGQHTLNIAPRESVYLDLIAITDNPGMFEQAFRR